MPLKRKRANLLSQTAACPNILPALPDTSHVRILDNTGAVSTLKTCCGEHVSLHSFNLQGRLLQPSMLMRAHNNNTQRWQSQYMADPPTQPPSRTRASLFKACPAPIYNNADDRPHLGNVVLHLQGQPTE